MPLQSHVGLETTQMPPAVGTDLFVGRRPEMAELTAALDGALEGRGGLVMLAG